MFGPSYLFNAAVLYQGMQQRIHQPVIVRIEVQLKVTYSLKFSVSKTAGIRSALRILAHFRKDVVLQSFD
jgi:hypothetical protein